MQVYQMLIGGRSCLKDLPHPSEHIQSGSDVQVQRIKPRRDYAGVLEDERQLSAA